MILFARLTDRCLCWSVCWVDIKIKLEKSERVRRNLDEQFRVRYTQWVEPLFAQGTHPVRRVRARRARTVC
jgi:hypothetical protein